MNRIYKVIWSKVKHQYVVVSELAHRDGKRSSAASKSVRMLLAVLAVCGMTAFGLGMQDVYAGQGEGVTASSGQYVAIGEANINEKGVKTENIGTVWRPQYQYYKMIDNHKYIYTETKAGNFWVREGYTIKVAHDQRFPGTNEGIDTVIETYKGENADTTGILQSYQNVESNMGVSTLNGKHLQTTTTDMYVGAVNTPTTEITSAGNQFYIYRGSHWVNVGQDNFASNFNYRDVIYDEATGLYTFRGEVVSTENLYSINGNVGVFTTTPGGTEVYTGDVYGWNNEILVTGVDEDGNYVSYWGSENVDPNAPIGNMPMSTLQYKFDVVNDNIEAVAEDNIKQINIGQSGNDGQVNISKTDDGQGGTIGLQTNGTFDEEGNPTGGAMIPGGIKITSEHGNDGKDVRIKFANDAGSFTVDAGSKVEGTTGEASGDTLTGLSINGVKYKLGGGKSVTSGSIKSDGTINLKQGKDDTTGITLSGKIHDYALDGQNAKAENGKVTLTSKDRYGNATYDVTINGLVTEDILGDKIAAKNNLTVAADADGDKNKNNWTITDTSKPEGQQNVFTNTTLDVANSTSTPIGTSSDNVYGQNFTIADTAGNQFTIRDIASAKKLAEVDSLAVKYGTKDGEVDPTIIELMNPYAPEDHSGGTTITNVAYADINGNGSAAVNVDLLKDTVANVTTTVTANEKHIATNYGDTADVKGSQFSVKDGKITLVEVDGNGATTGNAVVIDNVAAASDLGDVTDIHEGLMNKDENGNTMDTSVVDAVNNLDNKVGSGDFTGTTHITNPGDTNLTDAIKDLDSAITTATTEAGKHSTVSTVAGDNNIIVNDINTDPSKGANYQVSLNKDLNVNTVTATGNISAGSFSTGNIVINKGNSGTIDGLSNTKWDANNIKTGQAATEDQLKAATEAAVQYDRNDKGEVDKGSISLGYTDDQGKQQYTQIHNVAAGSAPTDAVNVSQLSAVGNLAVNNYNNIQVLNGSINKLDNRIDRVGAGAAALAALHPLDFDPDAKWDFAAGYGNYRGANAVAVGAYYRPNEDVMFSVGGSMGGGENMVNAGVSLKIGAGSSNVTTSRVAMAKEIKSMRDIVAKQDAQIQKLTAMVNALVGIQSEPDTTTMFPDVPENHWAYEAVEAMAKSGLVKGYPDGEFKGDRTMTRYEFAQIVYNAIQAGAEVDARLVEEFKPELEYFHIATVAKDKDGNPTIERVRAN